MTTTTIVDSVIIVITRAVSVTANTAMHVICAAVVRNGYDAGVADVICATCFDDEQH